MPNLIAAIDIYRLDIPRKYPFRLSLDTITHVNNVLIRVRAEDGRYGFGEASPVASITGETQATNLAAAPALARHLLGQDALAIEARLESLNRALAGNTTLKSAFDMALYDLAAKVAGQPLYAFLGGERRVLYTDDTLGIDTPEAMAVKASDMLARGFPAVKIKLGTTAVEDIARARAVREAIGPHVPLRIDANQAWDVTTAVQILNALAPYNIQYCEEPVPHWNNAGLAQVRARSPIPIMADESVFDHHDAYRLAAMNACDYFNIKLSKSGGIHTALKINAVAEAAGIACMVGSMFETRLGGSAAAHLVSARPNIRFTDLDSATGHATDPVLGGMTYDGGAIHLPDAPGHGADFDPAFLAGLEQVTIS
jgi:L-alanine-DL-glutamate epimerase-like enolase superfamily enzyme